MNYIEKDTILYLNGVELGYGEGNDYKPVLKDINIIEKDIYREGYTTGQIIAVVGRSGRGKSTLFKALTGLVKPKQGTVLITELKSDDPTDAKQVEEGDVGFVDQKYTLFRHKTVKQTFMYALRKSGKTKKEKEELIASYLTVWGLSGHENQYPCELSGGQRQRTAIIEQLLSSGHFMVLDEPTSGLDVPGIENVKKALRYIQGQHELNTVIFCTHLIEFAVEMADCVYFIGQPTEDAEYSTIIKKFDLKALGVSWTPFSEKHISVINEIKTLMQKH